MRRALLAAAALAALTLLSRAPFATQLLWAWDSVLYARAIEDGFHVDDQLRSARPHPPGYIFYVAAGSLLRPLLADTNAALVAVSVLASALAIAAVYLFSRRIAGPAAAAIAAGSFLANPLVWLYGEVAYPYVLLAFLMTALAWLFREARERGGRWRLASSLALGIAAGFRQDLLLLLFPLWLWLLLAAKWRERALHLVVLGAACLTWFVPTALLSDGVAAYLASVLGQTTGVAGVSAAGTEGLESLWFNFRLTLLGLFWGLLLVGALLLVLGVGPLLSRTARVRRQDATFFALWIPPALAVYVVLHIGEFGYLLSVLPGLYVLAAALLPPLLRALRRELPRAWRPLAAGVALVPAAVFLFAPAQPFSAHAIEVREGGLGAKLAYVRANFPPDRAVVLARSEYLQARYYLPDHVVFHHDQRPYENRRKLERVPRTADAVVLLAEDLTPLRADGMHTVGVPGVWLLRWFEIRPGTFVEFIGERFGLLEDR